MNKEIWKDITGYEGLYQVSNMGRVKSLERTFINKIGRERYVKECILKPVINRDGYLLVTLCAGGKRKNLMVHRLVCEAFYDNPDNKPQVNHVNEDKTDNRVENLEWATAEENLNHGTHNERMAKSLSKPVGQYTRDGELIKVWQSATEAKRGGGFNLSNISEVANGKRKSHKGFIWRYVSKEVI